MISTLGLISAVCLVIIITLFVLGYFVSFVGAWYEQLRWNAQKKYWLRELNDLNRWCSAEFPIIEDVVTYLSDNGERGVLGQCSPFRDKLRNKYLVNENSDSSDLKVFKPLTDGAATSEDFPNMVRRTWAERQTQRLKEK